MERPLRTNSPEVEAMYPTGSVPEIRIEHLSSLCSLGYPPLVVTGALLQFVRQILSDAQNVHNPVLRWYLETKGPWTPNEKSSLYIEALDRWRPEVTEQRPGLLVKPGAFLYERVVIGDVAVIDPVSGQMSFTGTWNATHTIFALGKEGGEVQQLAAEIGRNLIRYSRPIVDQLGLRKFLLVGMDEMKTLKESRDTFVIPINMAYSVDENWYLQEEAPRLKNIDFRASDFAGFGL